MSWTKLLGLAIVLSSSGCKTTEAGAKASKAGEELKETVKGVVSNEKAAPLTSTPAPAEGASTTLMQWKIDRLSIDDNSNEVRTKPGYVICDITTAAVKSAFNEETVGKVKAALAVLVQSKGQFSQSFFFVPYTQSRELVGFSGEEFLIESSFSHREALSEAAASKKAPFEAALESVMVVANNEAICPKLKTLAR